ncbi:MAG: PLP-dependent aminotransferase family protein [Oscillospiraceae bacterium]|nr:PLP-dependent aminotransferase family protein [Oscillospiraceae bacterium]
MLTYELKKAPGQPLYESLYRCIREDILSGKLAPGEKLPSKRALAEHLEVSKITVEGAYAQLLAEGFIRSVEKVGFFVEQTDHMQPIDLPKPPPPQEPPAWPVELTSNAAATGFPFTVWMRLQRQVMLDYGDRLLAPLPSQGYPELRLAIADHLAQFRNMAVDPGNILIGAGTDFLYNLLLQLLGRDKVYAVEEPGYQKIRQIYNAGGVTCVSAPMDFDGVIPEGLDNAHVLHCSPSHHFPTGIVTPARRRQQLLEWASARPDRYIIEDDYDSEFRFHAHPVPALQTMDREGRVIYVNTFSKTLAPSIRISYMILPPALMAHYRNTLGFYSCTVPSFEQYTLARFLSQGHFEKHINRMRKFYHSRRNRVIDILSSAPYADKLTILEQDAGLHFLLRVDTRLPDAALTALCEESGIRIRSLGEYYTGPIPGWAEHCLVVNYSGLREENLPSALERLAHALENHPELWYDVR